jgi:transposase
MDKAYEGNETRDLARQLSYTPVVPPKENRLDPWAYDKEIYKRRNEVERLFRRLKGFRRVFTRFEKLDVNVRGHAHLCAHRGGPALVLTGPKQIRSLY